MAKTYDIAVLGTSAAGYAAAIMLAQSGRQVVVVNCPDGRTESPLADWIPADVVAAFPVFRSLRTAGLDAPFKTVCFHGRELAHQSQYTSRGVAGYLLRSDRFLRALDALAEKAKVARVRMNHAPRLVLEESGVVIAGRQDIRCQLLLIAHGTPAQAVTELALPVRSVAQGTMTACGLDIPLGAAPKGLDGNLHVVAFPGEDRLGIFFTAGDVLHVRIVSGRTSSPPQLAVELSELVLGLQQAQVLPAKLDLNKAVAAVWRPPGAVALELESHVAKRTLLIGTAGGFASGMTGQTLDASIRSAAVAVDVAKRALRAEGRTQEVLTDYKSQWRDALADRIRPPGTSLQMLLSMVLTNKAITTKFARAFLYGENL